MNFFFAVSWCPLSSGLCGLSCCLCSVTAVCLHVCKEGIRREDTEHPGPAEKTVSVCLLKNKPLCLTAQTSTLSDLSCSASECLPAAGPGCEQHTDLRTLLGNVKWSVCGWTISWSLCPEWMTTSADVFMSYGEVFAFDIGLCIYTHSVNLTVYYWGFSYDYIKSF